MIPYWLLFALFAVGAILAAPDLRPGRKLGVLAFGALVILIMVGLRDRVGVDWPNYLRAWDAAGSMRLSKFLDFRPGDPAFYTLMWGLRNFNWPYWSLNLICAAVFTWGLIQFTRQQPNAWLAIAVAIPYLVIVTAMSAIRQATAIGFIMIALTAFKKNYLKSFLSWTIVAATFHASAILVLPFAGLSLARNRFQSIVLLLVTAVGGYYLLGSTFDAYSRDYLNRYTVTSGGTVYRIWMNVIPAVLFLMLNRRMPLAEHERTLWRNFSFLALLSVPMLFITQSTTVLDRILLYAFPLQIMMLAWVPYLFRGRVQQTGVIMIILGYLAAQQYVFLNYANNRYAYAHYRNILISE